jgi:hypothetical protein
MPLPDDKIDDVVAEAVKTVFVTYVGNLAAGMKANDAIAKLERGLSVVNSAQKDLRRVAKEISL